MTSVRDGAVFITGATTDVGLAIAIAFAQSGCGRFLLADGKPEALDARREEILAGYPLAKVHVVPFDRSDEADVDRLIVIAALHLPRIDFAVNVISQTEGAGSRTGLSVELYDEHFAIYQRGAFLIERALLRQMLKQDSRGGQDCRGSIVNVVDYGPVPTLAEHPVIAAVANAVIGISKTDACDYAHDQIRINCVAASEIMVPKLKPELPGGVPLPRKGTAEDIANTVLWLSSPTSSWLTGLIVPVDGGRSLNHFW